METKQSRTCYKPRPGISITILVLAAFVGLVIGGVVGDFIGGHAGSLAMLGCAYGFPFLAGYIQLRDGRLSDSE